MIRGVIFDWGGVLMRTEDRSGRLAWDQRLGLPPGTVERIAHGSPSWRDCQLGHIDSKQYWENIATELGLPWRYIPELAYDFYRGDRLDHEIIALIRNLRDAGLKVAVLSNNWPDLAEELRALRVAAFFEPIHISARIGMMKPDPRAYTWTADLMDLAPSECVMIDDTPANIEGAGQAGMQAIHYVAGMDLRALLPASKSQDEGNHRGE